MAIFQRRILQGFIDDLNRSHANMNLDALIERLNRGDTQSLSSEWELVVLRSLSRTGRIKNEADLGGTSRVDIFYQDECRPELRFAADVVCPSDRGLDDENPVDRVFEFVGHQANFLVIPGGFNIDVSGEVDGPYGKSKMRLALPPANQIDEALRRTVLPWMRELADYRPSNAALKIKEGGFGLSLQYDATTIYSGGGHPSYDVAYSKVKNPVHNALKQKATQLRKSGFNGVMGIFVCDGDCSLIHSEQVGPDAFHLADVVNNFLRQNSSISFVVVIGIRDELRLPIRPICLLRTTVYLNPGARYKIGQELMDALKGLGDLPQPEQTPVNALSWMEHHPREGRQWPRLQESRGPYKMTKLRMSARLVLEILAGKRSVEEFAREFDYEGSPDYPGMQPFAVALRSGCLIRNIQVTRIPDTDDDIVEFEFGDPDPAISRFVSRHSGS